jgi:4-hydroxybenzoate polyprenyltransferase
MGALCDGDWSGSMESKFGSRQTPRWQRIIRELALNDGKLAMLSMAWIVGLGLLVHAFWPLGAQGWFGFIVLVSGVVIIVAEITLRATRKARQKPRFPDRSF